MTTERKPMRPRSRLLALAAVIAVAACTPSQSASPAPSEAASVGPSGAPTGELREVRLLLGFRPDVQFAPFYLAQQAALELPDGIDVTIEHASGGELIRLVADGQAEFGVADATDVMIARTSGIPITYVSALYQLFPVALIGPRGTVPTDPADLAGARIGTPGRFGSSWHALLALLAAGGLTPDDVTIREYPQFNQVEGLLAGEVDFITGFRSNEPLRLQAAGMPVDQLTIDDIAPLPGPGLIASDELIATDPRLVALYAGSIVFAQQDIDMYPSEGLAAAIEAVPTIAEDEETARAVLDATIPLWRGLPDPPGYYGLIDDELWRVGYDTMRSLGFIDGSVPLEEMYEPFYRPVPTD
jgi:NitT/TauT family transport system substrate-binding protein